MGLFKRKKQKDTLDRALSRRFNDPEIKAYQEERKKQADHGAKTIVSDGLRLTKMKQEMDAYFDEHPEEGDDTRGYWASRDLKEILNLQVMFYPYTMEESKAFGEQFIKLCTLRYEAEQGAYYYGLITASYYYIRDHYGILSVNGPEGVDLSDIGQHFMAENACITAYPGLFEECPEGEKTDTMKAYGWAKKMVFDKDAPYHKDLDAITDFMETDILEGDLTSTEIGNHFLYYREKKLKEYLKDEDILQKDKTKEMEDYLRAEL